MALLEKSDVETDGGEMIGRDPRTLTPVEFQDAGIALNPMRRAIRLKCLDCCGENANEVRKCVSVKCSLWPLRMGVFPAQLKKVVLKPSNKPFPGRQNTTNPI